MKKLVIEGFKDVFKEEDKIRTYFSPGRVNLIGEHIDYNGGFVMPAAITYGTYGAVRLSEDDKVRLFSHGFSKEVKTFSLSELEKSETHDWTDYVKGVFFILRKHGYIIDKGFDLYINSNMPTSAGLSSSSSLELLILVILNDLNNLGLTKKEMAILGREVENEYIGVNSGIMDQFSIAMGKNEHAILLNTSTLDFNYVPLKLGEYELLIVNTNKKRGLHDSKYNERFNECRSALEILKKHYKIADLCSLKIDELDNIEKILNNQILFKRVKHVITEQQRTIDSMNALNNNDIALFANLMTKSHMSLKDDYDVTGIELDTLVFALLENGALGARMTGAGFGGCTVSIVKKDLIDKVIKEVKTKYNEVMGYEPSFYNVIASDGTKEI
ncbi:galactokinase [Haploplasma modicum]|uniref:galactokinase n=1 Tax=Haploplasma modicum TaxID=2150 RepID=UPI00214C7642|nr:galactokinase [Haploplasma modicum]MCR1809065.1 galactokinase [Haploplasma modicum]